MNCFQSFFLLSISISVGVFFIVLFGFYKTKDNKNKILWLTVPARLLSIYALFTAWIWFSNAAIYLSLPFFIVSLSLNYLTFKKFKRHKWVNDTAIIHLLTFTLSIIAGLWFLLTTT